MLDVFSPFKKGLRPSYVETDSGAALPLFAAYTARVAIDGELELVRAWERTMPPGLISWRLEERFGERQLVLEVRRGSDPWDFPTRFGSLNTVLHEVDRWNSYYDELSG